MFKNTASQKWIVFAFQDEGGANPGEPVTGDAANITANLRIDGGAANAVDDVNPTELEDGFYAFDITAAESNGDSIVIAPASATANVNVIGAPAALYTQTDLSGVEAKVDTVDTVVDTINTNVGTAGAGLTNIGTIATVTNLTNLPTIPANWITAAGIASNAITSDELDSTAITAIWGHVCETVGSRTAQQILSILLSANAGVTADAGATLKDPAGTNTRISATINGSNERTAITLTPSS